jgi:RNA polymerase sigma-70 factor (ECF subfamily)
MNLRVSAGETALFKSRNARNYAFSWVDTKQLSVAELVRRCLAGNDEAAWYEFVRRFQPLIATVIVKTLRRWTNPQPALVDDLVQECYLKLCAGNFKALRQFDFLHENSFLGYLKVVASNVVQDYCRHRYCLKRGSGKTEEALEPFTISIPAAQDFAEQAQNNVLRDQIRRHLAEDSSDPQFSRNYAIFWLYFEEGLTAKAIASLPDIGLSTKGVESALGRLTRVIKESINKPAGAVAAD